MEGEAGGGLTMTSLKIVTVSFVVSNDAKLLCKAVIAVARVVGLVSGPVSSISMPSFKLYNSSYDICMKHSTVCSCDMAKILNECFVGGTGALQRNPATCCLTYACMHVRWHMF